MISSESFVSASLTKMTKPMAESLQSANKLPSGSMLPLNDQDPQPPNAWFCHLCGDGPYNLTLYKQCTNLECRHSPCELCTYETLRDSAAPVLCGTDDRGDSSLCFSRRIRSNLEVPGCPAIYQHLSAFQETSPQDNAVDTVLAILGFEGPPSKTDVDGLALDGNPHPPLVPPPEHSPDAPSSQLVDGNPMWNCCQCPIGANLSANHASCSACYHVRCGNCIGYEAP